MQKFILSQKNRIALVSFILIITAFTSELLFKSEGFFYLLYT